MKVGDIAVLRSGGPAMTIVKMPVEGTAKWVECQWFTDDGVLHRDAFYIDTIIVTHAAP